MLITYSKSLSVREASHQPAFMSCCLNVSHTCFLFLPSGRTLIFSDSLVAARVVSWKKFEGSNFGRLKR